MTVCWVTNAEEQLGGDGLVAARHLWHYGYKPTIYYPKQSKNDLYQVSWNSSSRALKSIARLISSVALCAKISIAYHLQRLANQLRNLSIPFTDDFPCALKETDHIIDAIFGLFSLPPPFSPPKLRIVGFSFSGEVREPFPAVIQALEETKLPVTSVDAPSSWNIENGPPASGPGAKFMPAVLVSLTAPKPLVASYNGRHFIGGR